MASLGSHINVWETCLQLLERKGYRLATCLEEDETCGSFIAIKGEFDFAADNPIELLGLVAIFEAISPEKHEPYWWSVETDDALHVLDRLGDEAIEREAHARRWRDRPDWEKRVREIWGECEHNLETTADLLGFPARVIAPLLTEMGLLVENDA